VARASGRVDDDALGVVDNLDDLAVPDNAHDCPPVVAG
jgi:hypothetical protein